MPKLNMYAAYSLCCVIKVVHAHIRTQRVRNAQMDVGLLPGSRGSAESDWQEFQKKIVLPNRP